MSEFKQFFYYFFFSYWCLECETIPVNTCEGQHTIIDRQEDVDDIKTLLTRVASTFSQAAYIRKKVSRYLKRFTATNDESVEKLMSLAEENHLIAGKIGSRYVVKKINKVLKEAQKELAEAERLWTQITTGVKKHYLELVMKKNYSIYSFNKEIKNH